MQQLNNKKNGSTLIEVIVVVTILAILATITIPGFNFLHQQSVVSEIDKLHIICNLIQKQSVATNKKNYIVINTIDNSYFYHNHNETLANNITFDFTDGVKGPPANPKRKVSSACTFKNNKITFYKNGSISAGTLYLKSKNSKTTYALTVPVSHVSFIRKYKFEKNKWIYLK